MSSLSDKERDVEASRARLYETIDRIQDRLTPAGLMDEAIGIIGVPRLRIGAGGPDGGGGVVSAMLRRHPVPVMVAAAGIGWLVWQMNKRRTERGLEPLEVASFAGLADDPADGTLQGGVAVDPLAPGEPDHLTSGRVRVYPPPHPITSTTVPPEL